VVGLPRTGTTILFDLLSLDPNARSPREWEISMPWPAPQAATFDSDPRIAILQDSYNEILKVSPEMNDIHRLDASRENATRSWCSTFPVPILRHC